MPDPKPNNRKPTPLAIIREPVSIRDGSLEVRGLFTHEVLAFLRRNPALVVEVYQRFIASEDFGDVVLFIMTEHTAAAFDLVLTAAEALDEEVQAGEPTWRELLPQAPIEDFVALLSTVYRLTMSSDEALKKTLEIISGGQRLLVQIQTERALEEVERLLDQTPPKKRGSSKAA